MRNKRTRIMAFPEVHMTSFSRPFVTENLDFCSPEPLDKAPHSSPCVGK